MKTTDFKFRLIELSCLLSENSAQGIYHSFEEFKEFLTNSNHQN